jgi:hypothetical protein
MSIEDLWDEALKFTEIVRLPIKRLLTFGSTQFEYIFLAPSLVNKGDTVIRRGKMDVDKPALILPQGGPNFTGFNSSEDSGIQDDALRSFFYLRGISFPSFTYTNESYELDIMEGSLAKAEKQCIDHVRAEEKISTGIVIGKDTSWQFSLLLMGCSMIDAHIDSDLREILKRIRKK